MLTGKLRVFYCIFNFARCRMSSSSRGAWILDSSRFSSFVHPRSENISHIYPFAFILSLLYIYFLKTVENLDRNMSQAGSRILTCTAGRRTLRICYCDCWGRRDTWLLLYLWSSAYSSGLLPWATQLHCKQTNWCSGMCLGLMCLL